MGGIVYICSNCGAIFRDCNYQGKKHDCFNGVYSPFFFLKHYVRCPVCGHTLNNNPKIEIYNMKKNTMVIPNEPNRIP